MCQLRQLRSEIVIMIRSNYINFYVAFNTKLYIYQQCIETGLEKIVLIVRNQFNMYLQQVLDYTWNFLTKCISKAKDHVN